MKKITPALAIENKKESYDLILEILWDKSFDGYKLEALNSIERPIIVSQIFQDSVNGGGINSFFYNFGGKVASESLHALEQIGATKVAEILKEAIEIFPINSIPEDIETCRNIMEMLPDENDIDARWNELSNVLYDMDEYLVDVTLEYVRKNEVEFD